MKISKADARTWFEFFASLPEYEELSPRQEEIVWAALRQIEEAVEAEQRRLIGEIPGVDSLDGRTLFVGPKERFSAGCRSCLMGTGLSAIRKTNRCNVQCRFCYNYGELDCQPPIGEGMWEIGGAKYAEEHHLSNVAFLRTRIEFIEALFGRDEVSEVWITFADPQIGREKKRLTSPLFLERYRSFLKPGGIVHLKTDSRYLHEYSRAVAEQNGLKILACATDIYGADRQRLLESPLASVSGADAVKALFEVQTFYEKQYLARGIDITYLAFTIDHEGAYQSPDWDESLYER